MKIKKEKGLGRHLPSALRHAEIQLQAATLKQKYPSEGLAALPEISNTREHPRGAVAPRQTPNP
jgi:hypothetical protein